MKTSVWISIFLTTFDLDGSFSNRITSDESDINIYCNGTELEVFIRNHSGPMMTKIRAKFYQCPSVASYFNVLESLNVNISSVEELELTAVSFKSDQLYASQFKESTRQTRIKTDNVPMSEWKRCNKLKKLIIEEGDISGMKEGWLKSCLQLSYLHMERMKSLTPRMLQNTLIGLTSLVTLKVRNCDLEVLDDEVLANFHKLKHLDLSHNALRHLILNHVPSLIHLDLSYNNFYDKEAVSNLMTIHANLQNLSLAFNPLLDMCTKGQNTTSITLSHPTLERLNLSSTGATNLCFYEMNALTHLDLSNNQIYNLTTDDLPDSLLWVDLSGNQLSQIDVLTLEMIFNVSSRRVRFAGNPIPCDCEHWILVKMLQQYLEQLEDSDKLICWGLDKAMSSVDSEALCITPMNSWLIAVIAIGGTLLVLLALYCCFMMLFPPRRTTIATSNSQSGKRTDRPYDVFISYVHGDEEFVMEELLPGLETGPPCYRVCIHIRDWVVGDWIPAQITRSVEQSWCTIVVLSEHYVTSIWGMLEFRAAYEAAMTKTRGTTRIIVVTLDDVINDERLDPVLHSFLRCNTFLQWGDKWFWSKLRRVIVLPYSFQSPVINVNMELVAIQDQPQGPLVPPPIPPPCISDSDSSRAFCGVNKDCAYCLHLQLYREPKDRYRRGQTKASLSLQQFLGFESGFTLDKESNTIAIICQDVTVVLAFETRERLIAWQVKVGGQLGSSREFLVMIGGGKKLPAGPARMHLQGRRFALTSGVPPRLMGLWELAHLRRYGVVEGRFCFEGGSHCGKGEGLHMLITDQAQEITDAFDSAARGNLSLQRPPASRKSAGAEKGNKTRPSTRLSDFNTVDQSIPDTSSGLYEENFFGEDCAGVSPFWPSDERREFEEEDICANPPWSGADHVTLERCSNCLTKLGAMSRSSTVALTPSTHFNPAWTMDAVPESSSDSSSNNTEYLTPRMIRKNLEACQCKDKPPQRPPKPASMEQKKPPAPLPQGCGCAVDENNFPVSNPKVGPYENYDIPKTTHTDQVDNTEYYDTPKRIKKALVDDLFQVTKSSSPGSLVLKKNCGCILKFGSKKKPVIVECEENLQPVECPCQKVTNWANNLISLPYCKRDPISDKINTEILTSQKAEEMAIYATVDVTRKTNRQSGTISEKDSTLEPANETAFTNYQNIEPTNEPEFEGPYANYENLEFALSLEYYENAKDLLKKAGVTQSELDALSANVNMAATTLPKKPRLCGKCCNSQPKKYQELKKNKSDEYLLMEPSKDIKRDLCRTIGPNPGYTPMSPNPNWSQSLKHPQHKLTRCDIEKSLSIPTLNGSGNRTQSLDETTSNNNKEAIQKRSSSVDSARLLEDLKEFDSSIGSHATSSSLETLRNLAIESRRSQSPCDNDRECYDCCKSSGSENKTSEESSSKEVPHLRNKLIDNAQIKRSSSVPCKSGGNRDSSSSNDSGVSSCSMKHGGEFNEFEMPLTSGHSRYQYMLHRRMRGNMTGCLHSSLPRKSKSSDPLRDLSMQVHRNVQAKSSSAEAEVPVLPPKQLKGVMDTHSTSSGTSDMSDYIETLSLTSSHSSSDTPPSMRINRQSTSTLRPRSGKEYHNLDPIITSMYKSGKELANYTNLP